MILSKNITYFSDFGDWSLVESNNSWAIVLPNCPVFHVTMLLKGNQFSLPQIQCSAERGRFCPRLSILASIDIGTQSTQTSAKFLILLQTKALVSWMCFIISNDLLYTTHHNLLGIYVISSKSVIYMGLLISRPSVFVWGPEACLSMVSLERCTLYVGKPYLR